MFPSLNDIYKLVLCVTNLAPNPITTRGCTVGDEKEGEGARAGGRGGVCNIEDKKDPPLGLRCPPSLLGKA